MYISYKCILAITMIIMIMTATTWSATVTISYIEILQEECGRTYQEYCLLIPRNAFKNITISKLMNNHYQINY